jgi:hypothetical protein
MTFSKKLLGPIALSLMFLPSSFLPATAMEELTVYADQSQIVTVSRPPGTVVVGNPTIADVTIQGNQLFVHGRVYGNTNIIVLDEDGNQLTELAVAVHTRDDYVAVVFKGGGIQQSYSCKTDCESIFHIGDSMEYYKLINEQEKNKLSLAQGQKTGESGNSSGGQSPPAQ